MTRRQGIVCYSFISNVFFSPLSQCLGQLVVNLVLVFRLGFIIAKRALVDDFDRYPISRCRTMMFSLPQARSLVLTALYLAV